MYMSYGYAPYAPSSTSNVSYTYTTQCPRTSSRELFESPPLPRPKKKKKNPSASSCVVAVPNSHSSLVLGRSYWLMMASKMRHSKRQTTRFSRTSYHLVCVTSCRQTLQQERKAMQQIVQQLQDEGMALQTTLQQDRAAMRNILQAKRAAMQHTLVTERERTLSRNQTTLCTFFT